MQSRCSDGEPKVLQSGLCPPGHRSGPRLGSGRGSRASRWGSSSGIWATAWEKRSPPPSIAFTRRRRRWTAHFGELELPAHLHRPLQRLLSEVSEHVEEHLVWELCHSCQYFCLRSKSFLSACFLQKESLLGEDLIETFEYGRLAKRNHLNLCNARFGQLIALSFLTRLLKLWLKCSEIWDACSIAPLVFRWALEVSCLIPKTYLMQIPESAIEHCCKGLEIKGLHFSRIVTYLWFEIVQHYRVFF